MNMYSNEAHYAAENRLQAAEAAYDAVLIDVLKRAMMEGWGGLHAWHNGYRHDKPQRADYAALYMDLVRSGANPELLKLMGVWLENHGKHSRVQYDSVTILDTKTALVLGHVAVLKGLAEPVEALFTYDMSSNARHFITLTLYGVKILVEAVETKSRKRTVKIVSTGVKVVLTPVKGSKHLWTDASGLYSQYV